MKISANVSSKNQPNLPDEPIKLLNNLYKPTINAIGKNINVNNSFLVNGNINSNITINSQPIILKY